jgi:tetratricopeptide (TPR) repeat protein
LLQPSGGVFEELASDPQWPRRLIDRARQRRKDPSRPLGDGVPLAVALVAAEAKDFSAADEFIELALQARAPSKAQVMIAWGLEMMLVGQYERAAKILERAIAESGMPDKAPMLHLQRASALEQAGKLDEALGEAKKAVALSPGSSRVRCGMALILYRAKRYDDAEKENLQLLKQFDSNYESSETRDDMLQARMMLSNICVEQKRLAEAEEWLEQVLDEHPEHIGALNDLGYLWADQGKRLHRAVEMVRQAVQGEPDNAAYRDSLGWAYYRLGRYEEAVKELEKAAAGEKPDGIILDHLGDAHWKMNHPEQAVAAWRKALEALASDQEKSSAIKIKIEKHKTKQPDRT